MLSYFLCVAMVGSTVLFPSGGTAVAAGPWTLRTSGTTNELDGARYGGGLWLVPGIIGSVLKSADNGASWTAVSGTGAGAAWYDAWYTGSTWVMVGQGGAIKTSIDLSTWTARTSGSTQDLWGITSDGTTVVAVGYGAKITTAPAANPVTWTAQTVGTRNFEGVTYGGGQFVAVGDSGTIYTSPDGTAWTQRTSGTAVNLYNVAFGNNLYVAVGASGTVLTSTDGVTWTPGTSGTSAILYGVTYGGGQFVAAGSGGTIISSTSGTAWVSETSGTANDLYRIGVGNGVFVAVGANGTIATRAALSSNANLSNLTLSSGTLSPAFASGTTSYTASVPYTATSINVTPTVADSTATVQVNGTVTASGSAATVPLNVGANTISVAVTAQDGVTTKTYTVTVTRAAPSTNANLSGLTLSQGTLTPSFAAGTTGYTATVGNAVTSVNVTPTVADSNATLKVNGSTATSGSAVPVSLSVGANTMTVLVTAQDGTTQKTYTVTVTRLSNNANLAGLTLSQGVMSPAFASGTTSYTDSVAYGVSSINVTPTVADATATVTVNGTAAASGSPVSVALAVGANAVPVVVTAQDGTTKTYTVTVYRAAASTNANLSGLALSTGTLSPAFAGGTFSYTGSVPNGTTSVNVTPTTADSHATLTVNGSAATSGNAVPVTISTSSKTTVTVLVTAEDGTSTLTYTVDIWPGPAFTAAATNTSQLADVGAGLTALQTSAITGATLSYTLTGGSLPAGITLNADGTFSGTATTTGSTSATIQVADTHGGTATTTLAVTIQQAPAFTGAAANTSQLISAGAGLAQLQATKATGETLAFSVISGSLPAGITLNGDGTFSGAATTQGNTSATIQVADAHGGTATTTLAVTVQAAPAYTADAANTSQVVSTGTGLTALHATAAAGETLTFSVSGGSLPAGITLNANGSFSGTATTPGTASATIQAADTHGGTATTTLAVTVQAAPAFTADATNTSQLVSQGGGLTALQVTRAAGETLTFTLTGGSLPAGITLNGDGTFSGTVTTVGSTSANIRVTDTHGGQAATTLAVTVQAAPAFTADAANTSQFISTSAGLAPLMATGAAGETLTFTVSGGTLPGGITLNANGTFTGTATTAGNTSAMIQVADTHGGTATTTLAVTVQAGPAFTAAATNTAQLASVGSGLTALQATKATGETLTFALTGGALPAGITLNSDGTFTGTVTTVGSTSATITVTDTHGGHATTTLAVTVQAAPAFTGAASNTSQLISVTGTPAALQATKATGETLTFTVINGSLPPGITLSANGTFSGTATTEGTTSAGIQATDTHGGVATTTLAITVQQAPAFTAAASNTSQLVSTGTSLAALDATKATGETLTFTVTGGTLPNGISLNTDGTFSGTATAVQTATATIQAADTHGGKATTTLAVTVQAAPAFTGAATNTGQLASMGAGLTALQATKAPGETLTFTLTGGALPAGISLNGDGSFTGTVTTLGSTTATIRAADTHGGVATTTLAVTVQVAPAFTGAAANTGQLISTSAGLAALQATKAAGETLTFTVVSGSLPAGITLNGDGSFSGTATTAGSATATIQAADTHGGLATTTLAVTVQAGPAFTAAATNTSQLVSAGAGLTALDATKATGETLAFSVTGGSLPTGISLNGNGTFTGTVSAPGSTTATITVVDTHGGTATTTLAVTVQAAPAFTGAAANTSQLVSAGAGLAALQATGASGETLTFSLTSGALPPGITLNGDGTFSGAATAVGSTAATIEAADTHGGKAATTLAVTVQVGPAFTADAANTSQFISTSAGLAPLTATKATGETLTFTVTGGTLPNGIALNANGTFSGTATAAQTTIATIQAADSHGGTAITTLNVTVQAGPAFTADATNTAQTASVGSGLAALQATMATGEALTFAVTGGALPAGITLNGDGTFAGTVTTLGTTTTTVTVTDTHGGHAATTLAVTVQAAPAFTAATANTSQFISTSAGLSALQATKAAGETLTFTVTGGALPSGITLNGDGTFTGTATTVESTTAAIQAADTHGGKATTTLAVTVQQGPAFTAATTNTTQLVSEGVGLTALQATMATGETLTFTVTGGTLPNGIALSLTGTFSGTVTTVGTTTATIQAADTHGGKVTTTLAVTVQPAPAYTGAASNTSQLASVGSGLTALDATKASGETLTFTVTGGSLPAGITLNGDGTFTGTVTTVGSTTATIQAADTHGGTAATTLAVTVQAAPAFTAATTNTSQLISAGVGLVALQATKAAGETLTFTMVSGSLPAGITLNANGSFAGTATAVGSTSATIQAADTHGGVATSTLAVTVQEAPAFTAASTNTAQLASVGAGLTALDATKATGETLTFTFTGGALPAGIALNTDGSFTGTVTTVGSTTATITVADTHGGTASTTLGVTVQIAPAFTFALTNTSQTTSTGAGLTALEAVKATGETLTFAISSGTIPAGITLNPDGTFSGTATTAGSTTAAIQVADTHGGKATTTLDVTVQQGPVFTAAKTNTKQTVYTGSRLTALAATADAGQTMTFSLAGGSLPPGITLNPDGTFTGLTTAAGSFLSTIQVVDTRGGRATTALQVDVLTPPPPPPPQGPALTVTSAVVDTATPVITGTANMSDGATVSVTVDSASTYTASVAGRAWSVTVTTPLAVGEHTVTASGTDDGGVPHTATGTVTVKITPTVQPVPDQHSKQGDRVSLTVTAAGGTGSKLSYTAAGLPPNLSIDAASGLISGNVTRDGIYQVTVTVTDTVTGAAATQPFTWQVLKPEAGAVTGTVTDAVTGRPISGATVNLTQGGLRNTATTDGNGAYSFVKVSSLNTFTLTVSHPAYLSETRGPIEVKQGQTAQQDFQLRPLGGLKISGPADGARVTTPPTVTGTAAATGTVSVTLNGQPAGTATPDADGAWQLDLTPAASLLQVGINTVGASQGNTPTAPVTFRYSPRGKLAGVVHSDGDAAGIGLQLLDGVGQLVASARTGADGSFSFEDVPVGSYVLRADDAGTQVVIRAGETTRADLQLSHRLNLTLGIAPTALVGDGTSTAVITVAVTTAGGKPAEGISVQLAATGGALSAASVTTDANGRAGAVITAPRLNGLQPRTETITARIQDTAETAVTIRFVPATLRGVIVDNNTGKPVGGAKVSVAEDFDGDGVTDFAAETTTGSDGSYTLEVPRGNWSYTIHVTAPMTVGRGGQAITVESVQRNQVGDISTLGQTFTAERALSGQLFIATGGATQQPDQALKNGETVTATLRRVDTGEAQDLTLTPQGGYTAGSLNPGQYRLVFQVTAPGGQKLAGTAVNVTVNGQGEISLQTVLIDPYGTVTDAATGRPLAGVKMTLMWADTDLNRSKGRTPDTPVALPGLPDFAPNRNAMPQFTTTDGQYAWMVFPQGDYYIVAAKEGYQTYDSRQEKRNVAVKPGEDSYVTNGIIHVGETLVSYDLQMNSGANRHTRYVKGYPDGTFGPNRNITRAEVATVLAQLLGPAPGTGPTRSFTDVSPGHWAANNIAAVAAAGLMVGDPDGRFRPNDPVSRAEVAVIVFRMRQLAPATGSFPDVTGYWAESYIAAVKNAGIVSGYPDGTYQPKRPTTRAEFVTIINRTLGRGPLTGLTAPTFADVPLDSWASGQVEEAAVDHSFRIGPDGKEQLIP